GPRSGQPLMCPWARARGTTSPSCSRTSDRSAAGRCWPAGPDGRAAVRRQRAFLGPAARVRFGARSACAAKVARPALAPQPPPATAAAAPGPSGSVATPTPGNGARLQQNGLGRAGAMHKTAPYASLDGAFRVQQLAKRAHCGTQDDGARRPVSRPPRACATPGRAGAMPRCAGPPPRFQRFPGGTTPRSFRVVFPFLEGGPPSSVEVGGARIPRQVGGLMEVLKVSSKSNPNSCAGAMAGVVRQAGAVEVQVVGAGALNQAIKAIAIARGYLAPSGVDLVCVPTFADIEID